MKCVLPIPGMPIGIRTITLPSLTPLAFGSGFYSAGARLTGSTGFTDSTFFFSSVFSITGFAYSFLS